jgi:uncharacterized protein YndB with AHSA1/START domain
MKKSSQKIALTIDVTPASAWKVIGAVSGVDRWLAPITSCRVEGNKRYCTTEHGSLSEDILKVDHDNRVLHYAIPEQNMLPVQNIVGQMEVIETGDGRATVEWSWQFDVEDVKEAEAKGMFASIGNTGITGIEKYVKSEAI